MRHNFFPVELQWDDSFRGTQLMYLFGKYVRYISKCSLVYQNSYKSDAFTYLCVRLYSIEMWYKWYKNSYTSEGGSDKLVREHERMWLV